MATKAQKIRVGAFVVITAALLAVVFIVFGGMRFWQKQATYHIVFNGSVMGLEKGAQVHLNGMRVGRVDEIEAAPNDLQKVLVTITVKKSVSIHADTKAILGFAGITGLRVIDLRDGSLTSPRLPPGSLIVEGETTLDRLEAQAKMIADESTKLMTKANQIVDNLAAITDPKKFDGVDDIVEKARVTARNLAATSETLQAMVSENRVVLRSSLASVDAATKSAANMMDVEVAGLIGKAGELLAGLDSVVRGNEGQLRAAVFDLRQASRSFKELARDLRQKPSRLLFSGNPAERKLP